jgi:hypothetical protein
VGQPTGSCATALTCPVASKGFLGKTNILSGGSVAAQFDNGLADLNSHGQLGPVSQLFGPIR